MGLASNLYRGRTDFDFPHIWKQVFGPLSPTARRDGGEND